MKVFYRLEYWNELWKDWIYFDQVFYRTEEQARKVEEDYKKNVPEINIRITKSEILPKKKRNKNLKICGM